MKNCLKFFGIIASVALIGLSMVACEGPTGPTGSRGLNSYMVVFNFNDDGETLPHVVGVLHGDRVTAPVTPPREINPTNTLWVISGWYTDNNFENRWNFNDRVTANIRLYAEWIDISDFLGLVGAWEWEGWGMTGTVTITGTTWEDVGMGTLAGNIVHSSRNGDTVTVVVYLTTGSEWTPAGTYNPLRFVRNNDSSWNYFMGFPSETTLQEAIDAAHTDDPFDLSSPTVLTPAP